MDGACQIVVPGGEAVWIGRTRGVDGMSGFSFLFRVLNLAPQSWRSSLMYYVRRRGGHSNDIKESTFVTSSYKVERKDELKRI